MALANPNHQDSLQLAWYGVRPHSCLIILAALSAASGAAMAAATTAIARVTAVVEVGASGRLQTGNLAAVINAGRTAEALGNLYMTIDMMIGARTGGKMCI